MISIFVLGGLFIRCDAVEQGLVRSEYLSARVDASGRAEVPAPVAEDGWPRGHRKRYRKRYRNQHHKHHARHRRHHARHKYKRSLAEVGHNGILVAAQGGQGHAVLTKRDTLNLGKEEVCDLDAVVTAIKHAVGDAVSETNVKMMLLRETALAEQALVYAPALVVSGGIVPFLWSGFWKAKDPHAPDHFNNLDMGIQKMGGAFRLEQTLAGQALATNYTYTCDDDQGKVVWASLATLFAYQLRSYARVVYVNNAAIEREEARYVNTLGTEDNVPPTSKDIAQLNEFSILMNLLSKDKDFDKRFELVQIWNLGANTQGISCKELEGLPLFDQVRTAVGDSRWACHDCQDENLETCMREDS